MRDFPVFTTEYGVASLILKEVPYRQEAYIRIQDVQPGKLKELLAECVDFCTAVGAESVYAVGHAELPAYPLYTSVYEMRGDAWVDRTLLESLFPVTEETVSRWRGIYNDRMKDVDNAATLEARDEKRIVQSGGAYFVHSAGELLGIGWIAENTLEAVASVKPGAGERIMHTLMSLLEGDPMTLQVASTNRRAITLYERLGFSKTAELSRWYRVK